MLELDKVECAQFAACLNQEFAINTQAGQLTLRLTSATPLGQPHPAALRAPFALTFQGECRLRLPQGIYQLHNPQLGQLEIFLVQTGADLTGAYFEAVFN